MLPLLLSPEILILLHAEVFSTLWLDVGWNCDCVNVHVDALWKAVNESSITRKAHGEDGIQQRNMAIKAPLCDVCVFNQHS